MATIVGIAGLSRLFAGVASNCLKRVGSTYQSQTNLSAVRLWEAATVGIRSQSWAANNRIPAYQQEVRNTSKEDEQLTRDVIDKINSQIETATTGRLFAVVQICGKQFKVTNNDIIIVEGNWPPTIGDEIRLEKILVVGSSDFTLVGAPILNREQVSVDATIIEKTLSHTKTVFKKKKRKQYMRINFYRVQQTMLRINSININGKLNEKREFEGLDRIF